MRCVCVCDMVHVFLCVFLYEGLYVWVSGEVDSSLWLRYDRWYTLCRVV